jgi:hypothetical protein
LGGAADSPLVGLRGPDDVRPRDAQGVREGKALRWCPHERSLGRRGDRDTTRPGRLSGDTALGSSRHFWTRLPILEIYASATEGAGFVNSTAPSASRGTSHDDIVLRLDRPGELFSADVNSIYSGTGRLISGMEELVQEFLARRTIRLDERVVVVLPAVERGVRRYCQLRVEQRSREVRLLWRQGVRSLTIGFLLFLAGLVLSFYFAQPNLARFWQNAFGDGVFLVVAWVGLWYPLDLLFFARRPVRREIGVLTAMQTLQLVVRSEEIPETSAHAIRSIEGGTDFHGNAKRLEE